MAKRKSSGVKFLVVIGVLAGAAYGAHVAGWTEGLLTSEEAGPIEGAPARRGDLRISEVVRGNLEAKNSAEVRSELEGRSTIIYLVEEGTRVEKGDLVCELDVAQTVDEKIRQDIAVQQAELDVTKAEKQVEIQDIENQTDIASAELALELAKLDLEKYTDDEKGDWVDELKTAEETIIKRQEELARAQDEYKWSQELAKEGFVQANQLEADRLTAQSAQIALEQARRALESKLEYGNLRMLKELQAEVENKRRNVEKVGKQAEARMADFTAALTSARYKLEREREKLTKLEDQIGKGKLYAPETGLVVYAREQGRWGSSDVIDEGQEVRERQQIVTIPREGGMTVKASIHETKLKKIRTGMPCLVTIDAFPNRIFNGRVDFVAIMADSGSWRSNPNQRLYKADIGLIDAIPEMRPGMSANVEVLIDDLKDVVYVPRQCVLLDGGQTIVFVQNGETIERRDVEVGLDNAKWVSIESGVAEGEVVLLAPPASFEPRPAPEGDANAEAAARAAAEAAGSTGGAPAGFDPSQVRGGGGAPSGASGGERPRRSRPEGAGAGGGGQARQPGAGGRTPREGRSAPAGAGDGGSRE